MDSGSHSSVRQQRYLGESMMKIVKNVPVIFSSLIAALPVNLTLAAGSASASTPAR